MLGIYGFVLRFGCAALLLVIALVVFAHWGTRQGLLPEIIGRKLQYGQSYTSCLVALGISTQDAPLLPDEDFEDGFDCVLVEQGVGSLFVPQYRVTLRFDLRRTLTGAYAKVKYRLDEAEFVEVPFSRVNRR